MPRRLLLLGSAFVLIGCVALPRSFRALSYKNNIVTMDRHHRFRVGELSEQWVRLPKKGPGILFQNRASGATLATEALCGGAYEDLSLKRMTEHLFAGLQDVHRKKEEMWRLSGREALYTQVRATLDGAPVHLNIAVIKKNECQFDFLAVSGEAFAEATAQDFEKFVKGFDYE